MSTLTHIPAGTVDAEDHPDGNPIVGEWVLVTLRKGPHDDADELEVSEHLGCVTHIGSNYAKVTFVQRGTTRVDLDDFWRHCRRAPDATERIESEILAQKRETARLMGQIKAITAGLSISPDRLGLPGLDTQALVLATSRQPVEDYKTALMLAKTETIPALMKAIKESNEEMATWMSAALIPIEAEVSKLGDSKALIEAQIFHVELYAGLCESVEQIANGSPAAIDEPIHLLQRRAYMDEECLMSYEAGGMKWKDIGRFHEWIARPENRDRLLPHPRCVLAFRVRRFEHERDQVSFSDFINMAFAGRDWDKATVLYLRNGERLYCLQTEIEFEEKLFPDFERMNGDQKLWARMWSNEGGKIDELITDGEYQEIVAGELAREQRAEQWEAMTPAQRKAWAVEHNDVWAGHDDGNHSFTREHFIGREDYFRRSDAFKPYVPECLHYDDIHRHITQEMLRHNRLVLILQGVLDRSTVFHPHLPISLASNTGFAQMIRLVYDDSRALTDGEKPDFEAYRERLNATIKEGTIVVGQEDAWLRREAERENNRARSGSFRDRTEYTRYRPSGDPGPGVVVRVQKWAPRARKATFHWERDSKHWRRSELVGASIDVPVSALLNVDAYQIGDYKQFFSDPRTRADYLKWAPLLLAAEDYKAGKGKGKLK